MLGYALRCVKTRRALWVPALILAALAAVPGVLLTTALAPAATAFLLTADPRVTAALMPEAFAGVAPAAGVLVAFCFWVRVYIVMLWSSDERKDGSIGGAWRGTRGRWLLSFVLYAEAQALILLVLVVLVTLAVVASPGEIGLLMIFGAGFVGVASRAVIRIALTLALRAAALDGRGHRDAWTDARGILRDRRNDVVAAWMALVAIGVALWIGGRLLTPVLQDTALAYGHADTKTMLHEVAHLLFSIPIEAFLFALSAGMWTAIYLGGDALVERRGEEQGARDPWLLRALGAVVVLVLLGNGIPTVLERIARDELEARRIEVAAGEIHPEDALRTGGPRLERADYDVEAALDGRRLSWTTTIRWRNETNEAIDDLGVHVYPNAFTREIDAIPLAADLLQSPAVQRGARPGTLEVEGVAAAGTNVSDYILDDTALTIPLPDPAGPGETTPIEIRLTADLPAFPERYGIWEDITLLGNWIPVVALREDGEWRFDEYGSVGDPFVAPAASYRVSLSLPRHLGAVGTGVLTALDEEGDRRTWRFDAPEARDAAFSISPFWRGLERRAGDVTVRAWYSADKSLDGADLVNDGTSAVADFTRRFGGLPFDEVEIVQTEGIFGGMEYPEVVFVSDGRGILEGFPILPDLLEHSGFGRAARRYVVGHEVAHQWWYASAGNDQVREPWLDEALAEISTRLWLRAEDGNDRVWVMTNLAVAPEPREGVVSARGDDYPNNAEYTRDVYLGGSEILLRLRARIGAARFDDVLRAWHARARGRIGTIDEFLEVIEATAGDDAARFVATYR